MAEQFTGTPGVYVPIAESIRGFKEILEGKHDDLPERAFFLKGTIDEVVTDARGEQEEDSQAGGGAGGGGETRERDRGGGRRARASESGDERQRGRTSSPPSRR